MAKELFIVVYALLEKAKNSPKQKVSFNPKKYLRAVSVFSLNATKIKTSTQITSCVDPNDNMFLECAIDGKAEYCISSDYSIYNFKNYSDNEIELEWVKDIKIFHPSDYVLHDQGKIKTTGA
ncbi:PIN domain-containing protein [Bacillus subtilis]